MPQLDPEIEYRFDIMQNTPLGKFQKRCAEQEHTLQKKNFSAFILLF